MVTRCRPQAKLCVELWMRLISCRSHLLCHVTACMIIVWKLHSNTRLIHVLYLQQVLCFAGLLGGAEVSTPCVHTEDLYIFCCVAAAVFNTFAVEGLFLAFSQVPCAILLAFGYDMHRVCMDPLTPKEVAVLTVLLLQHMRRRLSQHLQPCYGDGPILQAVCCTISTSCCVLLACN